MPTPSSPFDRYATEYDAWFDSERGARIFALERDCLRRTAGAVTGKWLEVGVGTGRFADALAIGTGVDCSPAMLRIAAQRGITTYEASGEELPFEDAVFDGILLVCVICFLTRPLNVLRECRRVLKNQGRLVIGFIPADSPWGTYHSRRGRQDHSFYSHAEFRTAHEVTALAKRAGFTVVCRQGCELPAPDDAYSATALSRESFVVLRLGKTAQ